jgi:hypothetical protein
MDVPSEMHGLKWPTLQSHPSQNGATANRLTAEGVRETLHAPCIRQDANVTSRRVYC